MPSADQLFTWIMLDPPQKKPAISENKPAPPAEPNQITKPQNLVASNIWPFTLFCR